MGETSLSSLTKFGENLLRYPRDTSKQQSTGVPATFTARLPQKADVHKAAFLRGITTTPADYIHFAGPYIYPSRNPNGLSRLKNRFVDWLIDKF